MQSDNKSLSEQFRVKPLTEGDDEIEREREKGGEEQLLIMPASFRALFLPRISRRVSPTPFSSL
jgi:hypothetical protein